MDDKINDGGRAFPVTGELDMVHEPGMTLRDYFAGKALTAVIGAIMVEERHGWTAADFADRAYEMADAMIAARSR